MKTVNFFLKNLYNRSKSIGKDVFVIFMSVLLAFSVDRLYDNYQEKEKLYTALRNFYVETKEDVAVHQQAANENFSKSIADVSANLNNDTISLMEIDEVSHLAYFSLFSISLAYIEKNPNLVLDTEIQYNVSRILSNYTELSFFARKISELRISNAFVEKGQNAKNSKLVMVNLLKEIKRRLNNFNSDFLEFEKVLKRRNIVK